MPGLRVGVADLRDRIRAALIEKVKIACIAFVAFIGVIFFNCYLTFAWGQTCSGAVVVSVYGNLGSLSPYFPCVPGNAIQASGSLPGNTTYGLEGTGSDSAAASVFSLTQSDAASASVQGTTTDEGSGILQAQGFSRIVLEGVTVPQPSFTIETTASLSEQLGAPVYSTIFPGFLLPQSVYAIAGIAVTVTNEVTNQTVVDGGAETRIGQGGNPINESDYQVSGGPVINTPTGELLLPITGIPLNVPLTIELDGYASAGAKASSGETASASASVSVTAPPVNEFQSSVTTNQYASPCINLSAGTNCSTSNIIMGPNDITAGNLVVGTGGGGIRLRLPAPSSCWSAL